MAAVPEKKEGIIRENALHITCTCTVRVGDRERERERRGRGGGRVREGVENVQINVPNSNKFTCRMWKSE